ERGPGEVISHAGGELKPPVVQESGIGVQCVILSELIEPEGSTTFRALIGVIEIEPRPFVPSLRQGGVVTEHILCESVSVHRLLESAADVQIRAFRQAEPGIRDVESKYSTVGLRARGRRSRPAFHVSSGGE